MGSPETTFKMASPSPARVHRAASRLLGGGILLALLVVAAAAVGAVVPAQTQFAVTDRTLYLSDDTGNAAGRSGVLLMVPEAPGQQGRQTFLAPGVSVLGVAQPANQTWYSLGPWDQDLEVVDDATANLYFTANPQALTVFSVTLLDVAPNGNANVVARDEQQFLSVLTSDPVEFRLAIAGIQLLQGHVLALEVSAETTNTVVVLEYGGATPSALSGLRTRWLDTDGDGVPDSRERNLGRNPFNPNDPVLVEDIVDGDGDGLSDDVEEGLGTDPEDQDTDDDGWGDGVETHAGSNPLDNGSAPFDDDADGLPDTFEYTYFQNYTYGPGDDPDDDACDNQCEAENGTDPTDGDSDDDGADDGEEIADHTDPVNRNSVVQFAGAPEPVVTAAFFALGTTLCIVPLLRRP